jgi:hypothetical protein
MSGVCQGRRSRAVSLAVPPASERRTRSPLDRRVDNVGNRRLASPYAVEGLFLAPTNMRYQSVSKFAELCDEWHLQRKAWRIDTTLCCLGVEYATVQLLMPTNPEIHDRNALPSILDRCIPSLCDKPAYPVLQLSACQHRLRLVRSHNTCAHSCAYHSARMREQE